MYDTMKEKQTDDAIVSSFADRIKLARSKKIHPVIISIYMRTLIDNTEKPNGRLLNFDRSMTYAERRWAKANYKRYRKLLGIATVSWRRIREKYGEKGLRTDTAVLINALYLNNPDGLRSELKVKSTQIDGIMDAYVNNGGGSLETISNKAIDDLIDITIEEMEKEA